MVDQPPPVLIAPLDEHVIEGERGSRQVLLAPRHPNLGDLNTLIVTTGSCVDHRHLRLEEFPGAELEASQGSNLP